MYFILKMEEVVKNSNIKIDAIIFQLLFLLCDNYRAWKKVLLPVE